METIGWIFGMFSFFWCCSLSDKVKKLERALREQQEGGKMPAAAEKAQIRELLARYMGRTMVFSFEDDSLDWTVVGAELKLLDMDEHWVLVRKNGGKKGETEVLLPVAEIKSVTLK